jgi:predicted ATP-grasp superfamily ATP-dependent carboligase
MNVSTPVVVFGDAPDPYAHTPVALARTLGRLGVRVLSVHGDAAAPAARSRYARPVVWRDWPTRPDDRLRRLAAIATECDAQPILIPYDDESALFVDDHAEELAADFVFPERPAGLAQALVDKRRLNELCADQGIPTPATIAPADDEEVERFLADATYPIVLKGAHSWIPGLDRRTRIVVARDRADALIAYRAMGEDERRNVMLQEYIPGGPDSVWMFNGYFDAASECLVGFTGKKLRQSPPYTGATSLGVCLANERVATTTKSFMKTLGYRGILDIGYRYDARDGEYKLLDVNPRVGATFRLFVDPVSQVDVVRALYLDLTGQPVPSARQRDGRKWLVEPWDTKSSLRYRRDGRLTGRQWLRSFRGVEEAAWFARDDLRPFVALCGRIARNRVRKLRDE